MRRVAWAALVCATAAAGCLSKSTTTTKVRSLGPTPPADGVFVQSVLVEQPVGDPFLDRDLWAAGPSAVLADETRVLLAENGLPTADGTGFTLQGEVPVEKYPGLGFTAVLGPNDYLILGWPADRSQTLGEAMFAVEANGRPRQRVLVIRAGRLGDAPTDLPASV